MVQNLFIAHKFEDGQRPPMSTSHPPDVIHMKGVPRVSPFFTALPLLCILYWTQTKTKNWRALGMRLA